MWFVYDRIANQISLDNLHLISKFYEQINSCATSCTMCLGEFDNKGTGKWHLESRKLQHAEGCCVWSELDRKSLRTVSIIWNRFPHLLGFFWWKKYFSLYRIKSSFLSCSWGKNIHVYMFRNSRVAHVQWWGMFLRTLIEALVPLNYLGVVMDLQ